MELDAASLLAAPIEKAPGECLTLEEMQCAVSERAI
jgi:hypothetical protein